ncbi:hypothetical protein CKA34_11530 [Rhizobium sp. 11515TR]|nr:hypothetical protein CKA34_11530 [Rhizobium sp. 11515TR]
MKGTWLNTGVSILKHHLASLALSVTLAIGSALPAALPAMAAPPSNPSISRASDVVLVQERGSRRWGDDDRPRWRDRDRRHWHGDRGWDRRRHWDDRWRDDRRYHHRRHGSVIFEIRP